MAAIGDRARAQVEALFAAFAARDADTAVGLLHPQVELWAQPTAERTGRTEPYRGHDGFRTYLADVERAWERFRVLPEDFRVAGAGVIVFGAAEGLPSDGGPAMRLPVIWVFRLRDGLISSCRVARTAEEATELASAPDVAAGEPG